VIEEGVVEDEDEELLDRTAATRHPAAIRPTADMRRLR
jgi:hypothetical protein